MKYLISHRGNIDGPKPELENSPDYIDMAMKVGYDVEIDLRIKDNQYWLGHDDTNYRVDFTWLWERREKLWIHAKTIETFIHLVCFSNQFNSFYHDVDEAALTTRLFLWTYPGKELSLLSIAVLPETVENWDVNQAVGICSDYIGKYK